MITFSSWLPDAGTRLSTLAIELPRAITPAIAGLTVGLFAGVVGVIAVILFVGRGNRRSARRPRLGADEVVFIPPYGTLPRHTPLPPHAFASASPRSSSNVPVERARAYAHAYAHAPNAHQSPALHAPVPGYGFRPSSALSARVFAKMGYSEDFDYAAPSDVARIVELADSPSSDPEVSFDVDVDVDMDLDEHDEAFAASALASAPAVLVAPVVVVSAAGKASADASAPHPLGIIKATSQAMRPASIADLSFDDGPTEIGETYFDEPPQPRRRTDPPKIRPVVPAAPRFPEQTPRTPQVAATKNDRQHP